MMIQECRSICDEVPNLRSIKRFSIVLIDGREHSVEQVFWERGLPFSFSAVEIDEDGLAIGSVAHFGLTRVSRVVSVDG